MMQTVILGAGGQLGGELCQLAGPNAVGFSRAELDITDADAVGKNLAELAPEVVINTAAYTQVDHAESKQQRCWQVNADAIETLTVCCRKLDALLVYVSTDYVFGGEPERRTPYREDEPPAPLGVYAKSKLAGERHAASCPRHLIVRTCGLYSPGGSNFVETMLRLAQAKSEVRVVDDQRCSPSYARHVAQAILELVQTSRRGVYHIANRGEASWHEFAVEIFAQAGLQMRVTPITTAQYNAAQNNPPAARPGYSVLDTNKYHREGAFVMPVWQEALSEYFIRRGKGG